VTQFLTSTNFLQVADPKVDQVEYQGVPEACGNPFAVFEMADA